MDGKREFLILTLLPVTSPSTRFPQRRVRAGVQTPHSDKNPVKTKAQRITMFSLSMVLGVAAFGLAYAPMAFANGPTTVMCFNNITFSTPTYLVTYYTTRGATIGACGPVSPT